MELKVTSSSFPFLLEHHPKEIALAIKNGVPHKGNIRDSSAFKLHPLNSKHRENPPRDAPYVGSTGD